MRITGRKKRKKWHFLENGLIALRHAFIKGIGRLAQNSSRLIQVTCFHSISLVKILVRLRSGGEVFSV